MKVPKALTIAGSDTSGGAGLQADIKTFQEFGVYGMTAITVLVAQNPANNWAHDVYPLSLEALEAQINTVLGGIGVDAMKTGMLGTVEIISLVARKLDEYQVKNIVIDPEAIQYFFIGGKYWNWSSRTVKIYYCETLYKLVTCGQWQVVNIVCL